MGFQLETGFLARWWSLRREGWVLRARLLRAWDEACCYHRIRLGGEWEDTDPLGIL